jgi:hypothetical protein
VYHDIEEKMIDFDLHIAPSIIKDMMGIIVFDIELVSKETLYSLSCILNKNDMDL